MADARPPLVAELVWSGELAFGASSNGLAAVIDGDSRAGLSPMQYAAIGLAGCMSADVVDILRKGRHPLSGFRTTFTGTRAETPPRRFLRITLHFEITRNVPADAVERAINLSREKYCSV
jgi:putative redox protein